MRRMTDRNGQQFIDRGLGWVPAGVGQSPPLPYPVCPDGYVQNNAPWAGSPACVPMNNIPAALLPPVCPGWTTWSPKRQQCDLPHGSYGDTGDAGMTRYVGYPYGYGDVYTGVVAQGPVAGLGACCGGCASGSGGGCGCRVGKMQKTCPPGQYFDSANQVCVAPY